MCLAVAGRILSDSGEGVTRTGVIELGGEPRQIYLGLLPEATVGMWVTVHAGHAIGILSEEEAAELAGLSDEMAEFL